MKKEGCGWFGSRGEGVCEGVRSGQNNEIGNNRTMTARVWDKGRTSEEGYEKKQKKAERTRGREKNAYGGKKKYVEGEPRRKGK